MDKLKILNEYFGYYSLKCEQNEIIDAILSGNDCMGLLPTGYGKSVTFQLPALIFEGITLVISPLIALMQDQVINLKKKGIKAEFINSLLEDYEQDIIYEKLKNNMVKILYVSAERLQTKRFIYEIKRIKISLIVFDEAHTVLWSEDFRKAIGEVPSFISSLGYRPTHLALTATATRDTIDKIKRYFMLDSPRIVSANCDRKNIFYRIERTYNKMSNIIKYISKYKNKLGIIYCLTIKNCIYVYNYLKSMNYKVGLYHGQLDSNDKKVIQYKFSSMEINIIVCTNAFGMGIDIPNIRYVIQYDLPASVEDFVQQSGRASRDGEYAESILLFDVNDIKTLNYFIEHIDDCGKTSKELGLIKKERYMKLDKVVSMCLTKKCIHQYICNYFNQQHSGKCEMCYNCSKNR